MSAEAENKTPEVKKDEEKTSEELKATKRAAEVSKTQLRPSRPFNLNLDSPLNLRNFGYFWPFSPLNSPLIPSPFFSCRIIARKFRKIAIFLRQFI